MILTINDEKLDGSKSIWTLKIEAENIDGPILIGILARVCSYNGFNMQIEQLKIK